MSAHNFWNNFTHGFMHGMFNSNPFFGCFGGNWGCNMFFNSCFSPFNSFNSNLYFVPNVFSAMNFNQLMPNMSPPMPTTGMIDMNKLFPVDNWQAPSDNNFDFNVGFDTFEYKETPKAGNIKPAKMTGTSVNDKYFDKMSEYILSQEGGYVNDPTDRGGETNKGITKATYDDYRRRKGLPVRNVREITAQEIKDIHYEFFTACGADKIDNPQMALMVFDVAIGSGVPRAKKMFKQSGGDINKFEQLRREFYNNIVKNDSSQKRFIKGWNNRVNHTREFASANLPDKVST